MKVTIIYDNDVVKPGLRADWGFSCLVETGKNVILFDTGANGDILLGNMEKLGIDRASVTEIFISHDHFDHTEGFHDFYHKNRVPVFMPRSCMSLDNIEDAVFIDGPCRIREGLYSTGELMNFEQSMVVDEGRGPVVIVGCAHPGVGAILDAASAFGTPKALIGGLHGFDDFERLRGLDLVCPTHCTLYKNEIKTLYPDIYIRGGAGTVIEL